MEADGCRLVIMTHLGHTRDLVGHHHNHISCQLDITVDLHCGQIQGFFHHTPVDHLYAEVEFVKHIRELGFDPASLAVVSPDAGGVARARRVADAVGAHNVVTILKRRVAANAGED